MKRNRFYIYFGLVMLFFVLCTGVNLQAQETSFVFSNGGGQKEFTINDTLNVLCMWNIGEPITEEFGSTPTHDASLKRLTQGFEQGEGYIPDPLKGKMDSMLANERRRLAEDGFSVVVWPNPSHGLVHAEIVVAEALRNHWFTVELRYLSGRMLRREAFPAGRFEADLGSVPPGIYLLSTTDVVTRKQFVCKIIKVL